MTAALMICTLFSPGQAPKIEWANCFGGSLNDLGGTIISHSDTGFTFIASTFSSNGDAMGKHGIKDVWLVSGKQALLTAQQVII